MSYEALDLTLKKEKPELFLLKPDQTTIAKLTEAYDIKLTTKLGNINELSFKIPYFYEFNHKFIENSHIKQLRDRYIIRLQLNKKSELFLLNEYANTMYADSDYKEIKCYSLAIELRDIFIRDYDATGFTLQEIFDDKVNRLENYFPSPPFPIDFKNSLTPLQLKGLLYKSNWRVVHIDPEFTDRLSFKIDKTSTTLLNALFQIAQLYTATLVFDTEKRTISIKKPLSQTYNEGLTFSYGHYLKTLNQEIKTEKMVTRLYVYGKDDLDISSVSPVGSGYIEDYSYYMYPFKRNEETKEILSHSYYLSDELCNSLSAYRQLLTDNEDNIKNLRKDLADLSSQWITLKTQLSQKEQEVVNAQYTHYIKWCTDRDDGTTTGEPYDEETYQKLVDDTAEWQAVVKAREEYLTLLEQVNAKEQEVQAKQAELEALRDFLSEGKNFSPTLLTEKKQFTIEREFRDSNQVNAETLYKRGLEEFKALQLPEKSIAIDIVNFLDCIEEQWNWKKLKLGATVIIRNENIGVNVTANIIEIAYDFNNGSIKLTIANKEDLTNEAQDLAKLINKLVSTSIQVERTRPLWEKLETRQSEVNDILNAFWDEVKNQVNMAVNQSVVIDEMGITIYELDENGEHTDKFLRATNGVLALTDDGGKSYKHAITSNGIIGERIYGRIITGEELTLGDPEGILEIHGNKGTVTDRFGREVMAFGLYNYDHDLEKGKEPDPLLDRFGVRLFGKYNPQIPIDDDMGIPYTRVTMDSDDGFFIDKWENEEWVKKFYVNSEGSLFAEDMTTYRLKVLHNPNVVLLDANKRFMDIGRMAKLVLDDALTPLEKLSVKSEWKRIASEYLELKRAYEEHRYSYKDADSKFGKSGNRDHLNDPLSPVWQDYPSEKKVAFWNEYTKAYNALNKYLNKDSISKPANKAGSLLSDIRKDITERPDNLTSDVEDEVPEFGTGFDRSIFITHFKNYYESAQNLVDAINTLIRWSSLELGRNYNHVVIDADDGIVITRSDDKVQTMLNATNGISIARRKNDVLSRDNSLNYSHEGTGDAILDWTRVFFANDDGSLKMLGSLEMTRANGYVRVMIDQNDSNNIFSIATDASVDPEETFKDALYTDASGKKWNRKLYIDVNGILYANDLVANRLVLRDATGDVVIDANCGFLNLNKFTQIEGTLSADNMAAGTLTANEGFIANLTVNKLKTLDLTTEEKTANYIDIQRQSAKWITSTLVKGEQQTQLTRDENGNLIMKPVYWVYEILKGKRTRISTTTEPELFADTEPCYKQNIVNPATKMELTFDENDDRKPPVIIMGAGNGKDNNAKGFITKKQTSLLFEYITDNGGKQSIQLGNDGIEIKDFFDSHIKLAKGDIDIKATGNIHINGTRIDLN